MAPRPAPRNDCPGRPALPCPGLFVTTDRERAPQGTGNDWKNLPGSIQFLSTQTNTTMFALKYKIWILIKNPKLGFRVKLVGKTKLK